MTKVSEVIVIGGGFSGLIVAERLSEKYSKGSVRIIEKCDRVGKKILATGNGRGNVTNLNLGVENYHSVQSADVSYAIEKYGYKSLIDYFSALGMDVTADEGRVYPSSLQASSVLDVLRMKLAFSGVEEITDAECLSIYKENEIFTVKTKKGDYFAKRVILSCGGKAQKQYGTDGTAYRLAEHFGHKTTKLYPSLVQIKTSTDSIRGLKGLKQKVRLKAMENGKVLGGYEGDLLFTDYGVSGNAAFFLSSYITGKENCSLSIDFLPDKSEEHLKNLLKNKAKLGYIEPQDMFLGIINKQIGRAVVKSMGISDFSEKSIEKAVAAVKDFRLKVVGTLGFDYAQVTRGGILFDEVDKKTFESKLQKGLYIVGEMLDVDGDCGGYNLQWAFSSAMCCAEGI